MDLEASVLAVVCVPCRLVLAEAVKELVVTTPTYQTEESEGGYVCTVQMKLPLRCHPECVQGVNAIGRATVTAVAAEERAANCMVHVPRKRFRVQFDDVNLHRLNQYHRKHEMARATLRIMTEYAGAAHPMKIFTGTYRNMFGLAVNSDIEADALLFLLSRSVISSKRLCTPGNVAM